MFPYYYGNVPVKWERSHFYFNEYIKIQRI